MVAVNNEEQCHRPKIRRKLLVSEAPPHRGVREDERVKGWEEKKCDR